MSGVVLEPGGVMGFCSVTFGLTALAKVVAIELAADH